jgi:hypothetical protein
MAGFTYLHNLQIDGENDKRCHKEALTGKREENENI